MYRELLRRLEARGGDIPSPVVVKRMVAGGSCPPVGFDCLDLIDGQWLHAEGASLQVICIIVIVVVMVMMTVVVDIVVAVAVRCATPPDIRMTRWCCCCLKTVQSSPETVCLAAVRQYSTTWRR